MKANETTEDALHVRFALQQSEQQAERAWRESLLQVIEARFWSAVVCVACIEVESHRDSPDLFAPLYSYCPKNG